MHMALAYRYTYPTRTRLENWVDGLVHGTGAGWGIWQASLASSPSQVLCAAILVALFSVSAAYHLTPIEALREYLRRADHGLIFLTIAAVTTPFVTQNPAVMFGLWGLCLTGAWFKLTVGHWPGWISQMCYVALGGWAAATIAIHAPAAPVLWGAAWFCTGLVLFNQSRVPCHMALWHMCVIAGLACVVGYA